MSAKDTQIEEAVVKCDNCGAKPLKHYFMCDEDECWICCECFGSSRCFNEHEEECSTEVIEGEA